MTGRSTIIGRMDERTRERWISAVLFVVLLLCWTYTFPRWADWNQNSRFDLVLAIVDQGTLRIDDYYQNTGDYALFEGHYYSDKAPGTAFLGIPVYWVFKQVVGLGPIDSLVARLESNPAVAGTLLQGGTGLQTNKVYFALALTVVTFFSVAVPSAVLGVLLYRWSGLATRKPLYRLSVPLVYGLLTNAFPYANMFFGHQIVAALLFASFYVLLRIERREASPAWSVLAGFLISFAVVTEYPTALIGAGLFLYAILALPDKRWLIGVVLSGLLPGLLLAAHNYSIFHTILPVGYHYSELYTEQHSEGLLSLTYPHFDALWGITFGSYRGLFFISPILLLAVAGFVAWWRRRVHRRAWWMCAYAVLSFFLFNGSSVMWQGGYSIGPRYVLPMIPFLVSGLAYFLDEWGAWPGLRVLGVVLALWSLFAVWAETLGGQSFPDWTPNPLFNYSLPNLAAGDIARNVGTLLRLPGWLSLLPLLVGLTAGLYVLVSLSVTRAEATV